MKFDVLDYIPLFEAPEVIKTAHEITESVKKRDKRRTPEQIYQHSLNGIAVEHALFFWLQKMSNPDLQVSLAPENQKWFDIKLQVKGKVFYIDVKCLPQGKSTKTFSLGAWEFKNADPDTIYLIFDCSSKKAIFSGWVSNFEFLDSKFNSGGYVYWSDLKPAQKLPF